MALGSVQLELTFQAMLGLTDAHRLVGRKGAKIWPSCRTPINVMQSAEYLLCAVGLPNSNLEFVESRSSVDQAI